MCHTSSDNFLGKSIHTFSTTNENIIHNLSYKFLEAIKLYVELHIIQNCYDIKVCFSLLKQDTFSNYIVPYVLMTIDTMSFAYLNTLNTNEIKIQH